MKRHPLVEVGIVIVVLLGCKGAKDEYEKAFKETYRTTFVSSCTSSATSKGMAASEAQPMCECMAKHLTDRNDSTKLIELDKNPNSEESKAAIDAAVKECGKK